MESSTTSPAASTSASSVTRLTENPRTQIAATVPISATGIATAGISAERNWPMKTAITATTINTARPSEMSTSRIAPSTNSESSAITRTSIPAIERLSSPTACFTALAISTVFDFAWRMTFSLTTLRPLRRT